MVKKGCLAAGGCTLAPFLLIVLLPFTLLFLGGAQKAIASACDTSTVPVNGTGAVLAAQVMYNAGIHDKNELTLMVAIAGAETGYNPKYTNTVDGTQGMWAVPPPSPGASIQYFPPDAPADWLLDPSNNALAAADIAGGPGLPNLATSIWAKNPVVAAFAAAGGFGAGGQVNLPAINNINPNDKSVQDARAAVGQVLGQVATLQASVSIDGTATIMGPNTLTAAQIEAWYTKSGRPDTMGNIHVSLDEVVNDYLSIGQSEGVRGDMAFGQALLETGNFTNNDARHLNNFAGIAHCDSCGSGSGFSTVAVGVQAQIQLLKKVVNGNKVQLALPDVSPGWGGKQASTWGGLAANWASSPVYGQSLTKIFQSMFASAGAALPSGTNPSSKLVSVRLIAANAPDAAAAQCTGAFGNASNGSVTQAAQKLNDMHLPYVWGGGHGPNPIVPTGHPAGFDCSSSVSWVLQNGGITSIKSALVSGQFMNWGDPGPGGITIYANPTHVFMQINGRYFGTSNSNPNGGPGWVQPPGAGYLKQFTVRHVPGT